VTVTDTGDNALTVRDTGDNSMYHDTGQMK
jgi:hypothetical protein